MTNQYGQKKKGLVSRVLGAFGKGSVKSLKYAGMAAIVAEKTPLHEGIHALTATILPNVGCTGIALSDKAPLTHILKYLTFGYVQPEALQPGIGGYAKITHNNNLLGNLGSAATSAMPNLVTQVSGGVLMIDGIRRVKTKGKRLFGLAEFMTGWSLMTYAGNYSEYDMQLGKAVPGHDYFNVANSTLETMGVPAPIAKFISYGVTPLVCVGMAYGAAHLIGSIAGIKGKDENQGGQSVMDKWRKKQQERQKQR
jgi:hypothetical protein